MVNEPRIYQIIKTELLEIKDKFGDERRTFIGEAVDQMDMEDLIPNEQVAVLFSKKGFVKRMKIDMFRSQLRGGRGVNSMTTREEDVIESLFVTSTHDYLLCFASSGRVFKTKIYNIPEASRQGKGISIAHFLQFEQGETVSAMIPVSNFDTEEYLFMTTKKGVIKKTSLKDFIHFKNRPIIAITLDEGDLLKWVAKTNGKKDIVLVTTAGMVIRFEEKQARPMGRVSRGVRGIKIKPEDTLVSMAVIEPESKSNLLIITTNGFGKNVLIDEFKCQNRGGIGVKGLKFRKTIKGEQVTDAIVAQKENEIMIVTKSGTMCRQKIAAISTQRREAMGVKILKLDAGDQVMAMSQVDQETDPGDLGNEIITA